MDHLYLLVTLCLSLIKYTVGHGYMIQPPARSSAWRKGFPTPINYNDNQLNCGGRSTQHEQNKGKCGICGDNYSFSRYNEPGKDNIYATGTIVEEYKQGETINVTVLITAFHKGYFEFKLCQNDIPQKGNDNSISVTQSCFDANVLTSESGDTKFPAVGGLSTHTLKLPADVNCSDCVLQWRYRAGNSWGCEYVGSDKICKVGYGPQEEFFGCADVAIKGDGDTNVSTTDYSIPNTTGKTTTTDSNEGDDSVEDNNPTCYGVTERRLDSWCQDNCAMGNCLASMCWCEGMPFPTIKDCKPVKPYDGESMKDWCNVNCNYITPFCPPSHCSCTDVIFTPPN